MRALIALMEGTNCEDDAKNAFERVGFDAEKVHIKQLTGECTKDRKRRMKDYDVLFIPGGWSAGDYVRAGAIFAARMKSRLSEDINDFLLDEKLIIGVCNGFQVLVESGLLPGFHGISESPEAVLTINADSRFHCRPVYIKHNSACRATKGLEENAVFQVPIAHAEGRLSLGEDTEKKLRMLEENGQIVFKYCNSCGTPANGIFPANPNGSVSDIAGICDPKGQVLGMMPHPERVIDPWQHADWTRKRYEEGDGLSFFKSVADTVSK